MTIAKGLAAAISRSAQRSARDRIYEAIVGGSGFFQHGHTYIGHAIACAAALAVQETVEQEELLANVRARGNSCGRGSRRLCGHRMSATCAGAGCSSASNWSRIA